MIEPLTTSEEGSFCLLSPLPAVCTAFDARWSPCWAQTTADKQKNKITLFLSG